MAAPHDSALELQQRIALPGRIARGAALVALLAIIVLALLNVFGQRQQVSVARTAAATMKVSAPAHVRGGLLYQARIEVQARRDIPHPELTLDSGWFEQTSVNSIEPQPSTESTDNGRVSLQIDPLKAGQRSIVWIYFQMNPTNIGRHSTGVTLLDGKKPIAAVARSELVFP